MVSFLSYIGSLSLSVPNFLLFDFLLYLSTVDTGKPFLLSFSNFDLFDFLISLSTVECRYR